MAYRNYATANSRIVDPSGNGDFKTIAAVLTASASGQTIFIRPGTYTENLTLKAGVNLCAFDCDAQNNVIINGKCTFTGAGTVNISGIQLQTNSDYLLAITGSAASIVNLIGCDINATNNTGIDYTSSSGSSEITLYECTGNLGTTGIGVYTMSSAGALVFNYCNISNSGASTTASSNSAGVVYSNFSYFNSPISTSSTGVIAFGYTVIAPSGNTTAITTAGTGSSNNIAFCTLVSGSASAISVGSGTTITVTLCSVNSSNTDAVTGAGTLISGGISFIGSSYLINTTTVTAAELDVGGISFDGGANLLNKYSTGTFTPTLTGSSSNPTPIYTNQLGRYQRVGRIVDIFYRVTYSSISGGSGNLQLDSFPFTTANNSNETRAFAVAQANQQTTAFPTSDTSSQGYIAANSTFANIHGILNAGTRTLWSVSTSSAFDTVLTGTIEV